MVAQAPALFQIKIESAFVYSPKIFKNKITNRVRTGMIFVAEGEYCYHFGQGESFVAKAGDMVYLPPAPYPYEYRVNEHFPTRTYQIELALEDGKTGKPFAFSKHPVLIDTKGAEGLESIFDSVVKAVTRDDAFAHFDAYEKLYGLLKLCVESAAKEGLSLSRSKIAPALDYLQAHYSEKIEIATLARLCSMSESQLRRIFAKEVGKSPVQYKNGLQLNHACFLLKNKELSITEIAAISGFGDTYAFSHFFTKEKGMSPSRYRASLTLEK